MVFESVPEVTLKARRAGKLALIVPVMILTVGRCVAMMRWIPTARASWAIRAIGVSMSLPAVMMRSANSSMITTMYGMYLWPSSGLSRRSQNLRLYSVTCRTCADLSSS